MRMLRKGRFRGSMDPDAAEYSASLDDDVRLFDSTVLVNIAHVRMLKETDVIEESKADKIIGALEDLREKGIDSLDLRPELEDIHMVVEEFVEEKVGEDIGGYMHMAKSRNDQVSAVIRMVLREELLALEQLLSELIKKLVSLSKNYMDVVMPGYTHLQVAEPTTYSHYLCSYSESFLRDLKRLSNSYERVNQCPLGACAFAGTSFSIDRTITSDLLGFDKLVINTMDASGSRDFALEVMFALSALMTDLSRFSEEIVLWSSKEFDMLEVPEEYSATSSIMPQKKNPVTAELTRAKSGQVLGNLMSGLSIMKNLPQAYNLDLQELTPLLWNSVDEAKSTLRVMKGLLGGIRPKPEKMRQNAERGFATMTELANTLVREKNITFRKAHAVVGKMIANAVNDGQTLEELKREDLNSASKEVLGENIELSKKDFKSAMDLDKCIENRKVFGGPSTDSVKKEISYLLDEVEDEMDKVNERSSLLQDAKESLFG